MAIEEEDVGVDPLVEGCLGYHEQASVDQLYDDGEAIRLHTCFYDLDLVIARLAWCLSVCSLQCARDPV